MHISRVNRRAAFIVVPYAAAVIALNIYLTSFGYLPLVFYSSLFWIVIPLLIYSAVRKRLAARREDNRWR